MEQDLDAAGQLISRLQRELTDERHAYDAMVYLPRDSNMAAAAIAKLDAWRKKKRPP